MMDDEARDKAARLQSEHAHAASEMRRRIGDEDWNRLCRLLTLRRRLLSITGWVAVVAATVLLRGWEKVIPPLRAPAAYLGVVALIVSLVGGFLVHLRVRALAREVQDPTVEAEVLIGEAEYELAAEGLSEEEAEKVVAFTLLQDEIRRGPPWWQTELSGAHLLWWICTSLFTLNALLEWRWLSIPVVISLGIVVFPWGLAKLFFWYSRASTEAKIGRLRFYRWWGGWGLPMLTIVLPALIALALMRD